MHATQASHRTPPRRTTPAQAVAAFRLQSAHETLLARRDETAEANFRLAAHALRRELGCSQ